MKINFTHQQYADFLKRFNWYFLGAPRYTVLLLGLLGCFLSEYASAVYAIPQLREVPIDRLVSNLEAQIANNRDKSEISRISAVESLARLHAMAFAFKFSVIQAQVEGEELSPDYDAYFKQSPDGEVSHRLLFPLEYPKAKDASEEESAKTHLNRAIELYRQVVDSPKANVSVPIGLGWCLDQAGHRDEAIGYYRKALRLIHDRQEQILTRLDKVLSWLETFFSSGVPKDFDVSEAAESSVEGEVAFYLIRDLDPAKDQAEIDVTRRLAYSSFQNNGSSRRFITPLAIAMGSNVSRAEMVDSNAAIEFDLDGTRRHQKWSWITPKAAWVVYLPKNEPMSGLYLFGSVTFWSFWSNGYEALRSLDDNMDGLISGSELKNIALWQDKNSNGRVDLGEIVSLAAAEIAAFSYGAQSNGQELWIPNGVRMKDGSSRASYDLILEEKP